VRAAAVVVLDLWLASDNAMDGTAASELLAYYLSSERPVVVIDPGHDELRPFMEEITARVEWPPEPRELVESVQVAFSARSHALTRPTVRG
jgi:hypothetical protein